MSQGEDSVKRVRLASLGLLAGAFVFRLWFMTTLPLSGDESYHWEWSRHLAFGYYDHPGLTAYLIRLSTWMLGGSTEFTVRLPALLMLTGTAIVCYLFARDVCLDGGQPAERAEVAGFCAGLLVVFMPVFAVLSIYISTDPPLVFFGSLALFLLYRACRGGGWAAWLAGGTAMGLALLSKFLAFTLLPGVFCFMLLSPSGRKWFKRPQPYAAAGCALLVFSPFLWWNATHGWATFVFNLVSRQRQSGLAPPRALEFVLGQALALSPGIFAFAVFGLWRCLRDGWIRRDRSALFLGLTSLFPLGFFLAVSFRRRVGIHWPAVGWVGPVVFLCGSLLSAGGRGEGRLRKKLIRASIVVCIVITVLLHGLVHVPPAWVGDGLAYAGAPNRIRSGRHAERFGWSEMGRWVGRVRNEMQQARLEAKDADADTQRGTPPGVFVMCGQYGMASNVAFYMPGQPRTHLWAPRRTHGENYRFWDDFESLKGMDAVYVGKRENRLKKARLRLKRHFSRVGRPEELPINVGGRTVRSFFLVRCYDFDGRRWDGASG
jgi:4-amino-4-deoxy-L-arabinose transferase-like glycosyltransferase